MTSVSVVVPYNAPMKYSLRSLMMVAILGPPLLAGVFLAAQWILVGPFGVDLGNGIDIVYPVEE